MANASRLDTTPAVVVMSGVLAICQWLWLSPAPSTLIGILRASRARASVVTTRTPPPSVTRQQSLRRNGVAIIREARTSSIESGSRDHALGFNAAQRRAATATSARCSGRVPYSCICRAAINA